MLLSRTLEITGPATGTPPMIRHMHGHDQRNRRCAATAQHRSVRKMHAVSLAPLGAVGAPRSSSLSPVRQYDHSEDFSSMRMLSRSLSNA
jgi:hypothetical protein